MSIFVLWSFLWMERSPEHDVFFDGPDIFRTANDKESRIYRKTVKAILNNPTLEVVPSTEVYSPMKDLNFHNVSCSKLFNGDTNEIEKTKSFLLTKNYTFKHREDDEFTWMTVDCDVYRKARGYIMASTTKMESDFPLAFNILFHQNTEQLERLLRVLYRPQNQYCIHVDRKTPTNVLESVENIANCFDNVFVASKLEIVIYASHTRLLADINCMRDHIARNSEWKYLLNLASSELPLRSNLELVQILKIFNGSNDIHEVFLTLDKSRFEKKHFTYINLREKTGHIIHTKKDKEGPPNGLTITKGNAYNVFSRAFVEFALENEIARELLDWSADTLTPDEHYWATLNNMYSNGFLKTPGGFDGHPDEKPYIARYIGWNSKKSEDRCAAKRYIHNVCVFSVEDLPKLKTQPQLIANKFDIGYDPIAYSCMEEWLYNKTRDRVNIRNEKFYRRLAFVRKS